MKQIIAKNFHGNAYRFQRLPGEMAPTWGIADHLWWDEKTTVREKLGLSK